MLLFYILLCMAVLVAVPIFRAALTFRRLQRQARRQYEQYRRAAGFGEPGTQAPDERPGGWSAPPRRRKIITRDVGEYVRFTEVQSTHQGQDRQAGADTGTPYREPQVSDAEWEDID